jgi:uroporphyrinogen decarboxylase
MPQETMTPRERWLAVLRREKPDRVPMDFWATPEVKEKLTAYMGCQTLQDALKKLHVDFVVAPDPMYIGPGNNPYGFEGRDVDYGSGVYWETTNHPLESYQTVGEIEANYTWPTVDWWDFSSLADQLKGWEDYPVNGGGSEPFLVYKDLRGDAQAMLDLVENPEIVHYCLDKLFDLAYQNTLRRLEALKGQVTYIYVAEDMGGQTNLMISPRHIREFLLPGMERVAELGHSAGAFIFHHNDGNCLKIIPDMIETVKIDLLNPIQWRSAGMERENLKQKFGDRLIFHGAVDNQFTLPFGTTDMVRQEVWDNLRILGEGGGYILAPCHNIQPVTPMENIVALYETGYEAGFNR